MKKELNIAAILKDKPRGTKLWSDTFGYVHLLDWHSDFFDVKDTIHNLSWRFSSDGSLKDYKGRLSIYPAQYMRDWSKFTWKKGDVLKTNEEAPCYTIFSSFQDEYAEFSSRYYYCGNGRWLDFGGISSTNRFIKASDDEAKEFIEKIEEHYGGNLNLSTLDIEHPKPEFKDGDIVFKEDGASSVVGILKEHKFFPKSEGFVLYAELLLYSGVLLLNGASYKISVPKIRPATDSEKQQLFDALAKEGKRWNPDTLRIEDLPKKCEFKPMDWCLMRFRHRVWNLCQFAFINKSLLDNPVAVGGNVYEECIPYNDQTKHLLGTTDEWKGGE